MRLNNAITKLRQAAGLKVSYGLRAFALYIVILGSLGWFLLDHAVERLNDGMRQAAENVMVDSVNIFAAMLEQQLDQDGQLNTSMLASVLKQAKQRVFLATIYQVDKLTMSADLYVTDNNGIIVYDSTGRDTGKDFSRWRDVKLTLAGEYGARTSFVNDVSSKTNSDAPKAMIVAAPIRQGSKLIGVVSLATPINSLEQHLVTETQQMENTMLIALTVAIALGFILSLMFSRSISKIANYADKMASGEIVQAPKLLDQRLADLTNSVANLRTQLDGKEYVENYIHSLTHELKTPITGIQGAVELLTEGLPAEEQTLFLNNIKSSNQRMARLVERVLNLAKLESQTELLQSTRFELADIIDRVFAERSAILLGNGIDIQINSNGPHMAVGDSVLISQAIANLVDNAIAFAQPNSILEVRYGAHDTGTQLSVINQGELIPDFALSRVFERFFSLPGAQAKNGGQKSTGLGLSFVMEIMKLHRGHVSINNHTDGATNGTISGVIATLTWPTF